MELLTAVIFDMDGLMFDTEALNMKAWAAAGAKHGFDITEDVMHEYIGLHLDGTRQRMTERFGAGFDFDAVRGDRIAWSAAWIEEHGLPLKPGLRELLSWLIQHDIPRAMATSSDQRVAGFYLSHTDVKGLFNVILTGDRIKHGKPAPDIFLTAAEALGAEPAGCVVLEDSYNGIRAAHAAGMMPVMVPDLLPPPPDILPLTYRVVKSLADVPPLLEELLLPAGAACHSAPQG